MAFYDEISGISGTSILVGLGVALAAPVIFPVLGDMVRPAAKLAIKGSLALVDSVQGFIAETGEQISDLVAEVKAERNV